MIVSVITITYHNLGDLQRTIASVRAQEGVDIDHIVVDGDSEVDVPDNCDLLLQSPGYTMRVVRRRHRGVYDAINAGVAHANGDIIGILHAGDMYTSRNVLARVAAAFRDTCSTPPPADFVYGDVHYARPGGRIKRYYSGKSASRRSLLEGFAPPHPSLYISKRCAEALGPYDVSYRIGGDFEMFVRLLSSGKWHGRYLPIDMVEMLPGGLSAKWRSRLFINNMDRLRALRSNGMPASPLRLGLHYVKVFKGYIWKKR